LKPASWRKERRLQTKINKSSEQVETINPKDYPTLDSKQICLEVDRDIAPVLRDIIKLSKKVKLVDLLKVLHYNDSTTSLVEVPCSAKQSGFKKQARQSR
jgi:hypothetical protein